MIMRLRHARPSSHYHLSPCTGASRATPSAPPTSPMRQVAMPRRAMPRVVVIVEHQDPTGVASLNRTEPRTPRSATCCSVALGSAGACDPCNARATHAAHACVANLYPSNQESHPEPRQPPPDCRGAWCRLGDGVLVSAAFFCGVRGRLLALHPPKCSTSGPPRPATSMKPRHDTARRRETGNWALG